MAKKSKPIIVGYVIDKSKKDSKPVKCFEIDSNGNATDYLSKEERDRICKKMMENCGCMMSRYLTEHPDSALLN